MIITGILLFFSALASSDGTVKENEATESVTLSDIMNGILNLRIDLLYLNDKVNSNIKAIENLKESSMTAIEKVKQKVDYSIATIQKVDKKVDSSIITGQNVDKKVDSNTKIIQKTSAKVESNMNAIRSSNATTTRAISSLKDTSVRVIDNLKDISAKAIESLNDTTMKAIYHLKVDLVFVKDQVNSNSKDINGYGGVVPYTEGGHTAKVFYEEFGVSFIGYGLASSYDTFDSKSGLSLEECFSYCLSVRKDKGSSYDDIVYVLPNKCECLKNGKGHTVRADSIRYHFV